MEIEVDQSVKIEDTSEDTVLAFSNERHFAILIPAEAKRQALAYLRRRGKSRRISVLLVFAAGLFLLLRNSAADATLITIDQEYEGKKHEAVIKGRLLQLLYRAGWQGDSDCITFGLVEKKSRAHKQAWGVHQGKIVPDYRVTADELLSALRQK